MDINTLRGISTIFVLIGFIGITWWAYSAYKKKDFDEAANLPFADEDDAAPREQQDTRSNDK
ncbi:MAG: cbb3-type cytochrome c oxidase subunit 3 [Halopseudomonas yangmingensis]|uniref:Cytochrome c oxidase cbb3-type subunit 4 n=1 Tax=Halopseudomonas yangmingensis TaxID=1720063 RepID=A0A1I4UIN3_9GAMM|nr:cbb3-type cytochrome c oxidase subunit 3 [Halopseudomonas yangmingensis]SFM88862.1 cytochrome c oxidase cbb3-type subunit 4 [Halopseudomonas yangmingensis]